MADDFPAWSPQVLIDNYEKCRLFIEKSGIANKEVPYVLHEIEKSKVLYRVISDTRMQAVWRELKKHSKTMDKSHFTEPDAFNNMASILFFRVEDALIETKIEIKTRSEEAQKYQEIAKTARDLRRMVNNSSLDVTPYRWFSDEAINTILKKDIKPEKATGTFCLIKDIDDYNKKGNIFSTNMMLKHGESEPKVEYWRMYKNTKEWFYNLVITPNYPGMADILNNMASDADALAKEAMHKDRIAVKNSTSKTTIFIRSLYRSFWHDEFGSPLYRTFAAFCSVALNASISDENIRHALRTSKGGGRA